MTETAAPQPTLDAALELHRAGNLSAAAATYTSLLEAEPGNLDASYGLGTVHMQRGDLASARTLLEHVATAAPDVPEFRYNLGCVLDQLGEPMEAVEHFRAAYAAMPDSPAVLSALARSLGGLRNYPAALQAMEQALQAERPQPADVLAYADLLFMAHEPDKALEQVRRARQLGSNDAKGYFIESRCERIAGNTEAEKSALKKAIDLRPGYGTAWQHLLELTPHDELLALADECEALSDDLATAAVDKARLRYTVGRAYEQLGLHDEAAGHIQVANERQRSEALSRGKSYDKTASDRFLDWLRSADAGGITRASADAAAVQPIFIIGMPRSGTTLVERILGQLDGVTTGGESEALEYVTSQYYRALARSETVAPARLQPAHWDELAAAYWDIQLAPKGRVTDKMPTNLRHVGMMCRMFPQAPVVYLRRDPRDVAWSIYSRSFPDGYPYATDLVDIAHYCAVTLRLMDHFKAQYPERIFEIRYEELIDRPEVLTKALAEFCGLEWRTDCLSFHERPQASYTFSELQVREPLNRKGIGRWRNYAGFMQPFIDACAEYGVVLEDD